MIILWKIISLLIILCALVVTNSKNLIYSIIALIAVFFLSSLLMFMLNARFLPYVILIVYIGVILILFLFIVLTINITNIKSQSSTISTLKKFTVLLTILFITFIFYNDILFPVLENVNYLDRSIPQQKHNELFFFSKFLYTQYAVHFIIIGIGLLIAMIGSVTIASHINNIKIEKND